MITSPERPGVTCQFELLCLSGIVATTGVSTLEYVTKDDLVLALAGLEDKIAGMIDSVTNGVNKQGKIPIS